MNWWRFRNGLQFVHLWAGLILAIPFVIIGVTGSLIVAQDWIAELSAPAAPAQGPVRPLSNIVAAAAKAAPPGWPVTAVSIPAHAGIAAAVQVGLPPGRRVPGGRNFQGLTVYIDPVSLKLLGTQERRRQGRFNQNLRSLHIALMVPQYYGVQIVGTLGLIDGAVRPLRPGAVVATQGTMASVHSGSGTARAAFASIAICTVSPDSGRFWSS